VTLLSIDGTPESAFGPDLAGKVIEVLRLSEIAAIDWWIGHDSITGALALECKQQWKDSRCAAVMHMSYHDYAYIKHAPENAATVTKRTELQQTVLYTADVGLAVGPLLFERLKTIRGKSNHCYMLIPGLAALATKEATQDRLHAITFGRFDGSESLVKQAPLAVAAFARAFRMGVESSNSVLKNARIRLIGAPTDVTVKLRFLANKEAGRLVNLEAHEFIEDHGKLRSLLHECNVCLMLSWHEGFGLSGWEAIGSGVPLVLSKNSGLFQLLHSLGGVATGCVFPVDVHGQSDGEPNETDVEIVKKAILALASDIPKARSNAKALRQALRFTHNFTWNRTARDFAHALGVPVTTTILDLVTSAPSSEADKAGDVFDSAKLAAAQRVLTLVDAKYECGEYDC